ncbi:MAG: regulatory protein RecX [Armatimonadota bacterium]
MGIITAIETQKKNGNRVSIYIDGRFALGVHSYVAEKLDLSVNQSIDEKKLSDIIYAETLNYAKYRALRLIAYRDRSKEEIRRRLISAGIAEDVVDEVIIQLINEGLINDEKFCEGYVKSRMASKPMGKKRLTIELSTKGVQNTDIENALSDISDENEYETAYGLAVKKVRKKECLDLDEKRKLGNFLARRGFGWETIRKVIERLDSEKS